MKYKKYQSSNIYLNNYNNYLYSGVTKIIMNINHFFLEFGIKEQQNQHILEIGGANKSHLEYIKKKENIKSYTISDHSKILQNEFQR